MALEPSVAALQSASSSSATGRMGVGGRFTPGGDRLDSAYGNPFVNLSDQFQTANDGNAGGQGFGQFMRGAGQPILFTPRVSLAAASYPAIAGLEDEGTPNRS